MITIIYIERRFPKQEIIDRCLATIPDCKVQLWTDTNKFMMDRCENKCLPNHMLTVDGYVAFTFFLYEFLQTEILKHIDTSHFIMVQNDGYPINPSQWDYHFLDYDYVGAPVQWYKSPYLPTLPFDDFYEQGFWEVGNGGFSIRSKALMSAVHHFVKAKNDLNYYCAWEDFLICKVFRRQLENKGFKFAPFDVSRRFSCEQYEAFRDNKPFGFHAGGGAEVILKRELPIIE